MRNSENEYPRNEIFDYFTKFELINLDEECRKDLSNGHGFIIKEPMKITQTLNSIDSIFSSRYGKSLQDPNPYSDRYSCKYGCTQGAFYSVPGDKNWVCPVCGTEVKPVGVDFTYFGWIKLKEKFCLIHPLMYLTLSSFIGKSTLEKIIEPVVELDSNGLPMTNYDKRLLKAKSKRVSHGRRKKSEETTGPFDGIGMLGLRDRFDEIIEYYRKKKPAKKEFYDKIVKERDKVFIHSIPVYTTQLRISKQENTNFTFESTNADFNILAKLAAIVNKDDLSIYRNKKYQNQVLWDMQTKIGKLTKEIIDILSGKKGTLRSIISGRTAFSERSVIVPNAKLRMDEITLPYFGLCILMQQRLINIIKKSYNITYSQAYKIWYYASLKVDPRVLQIINELIKTNRVSVLINRNPTIFYQSIVYKRVVGCTQDYTMGIDVYTLDGLGADFDGDTLNILMIYNKEFKDACEAVYSPRNAFCISRNDGKMNPSINIFKDILINLNSLIGLSRDNYSTEQMSKIKALKEKYKNVI